MGKHLLREQPEFWPLSKVSSAADFRSSADTGVLNFAEAGRGCCAFRGSNLLHAGHPFLPVLLLAENKLAAVPAVYQDGCADPLQPA